MAHFLLKEIPRLEQVEKLAHTLPEADPLRVTAYLTLLKVADDFLTALDAHFARFGISQGRFSMLMLLYTAGADGATSRSMKALAEMAGVAKPTVTGLIAGLERDGLVSREGDPSDGRSQLVSLTSAGRELLENLLPQHFSTIREFLRDLTESEIRSLMKLLGRVDQRVSVFRECST